jgi:hypothetical protein
VTSDEGILPGYPESIKLFDGATVSWRTRRLQ